MQVGALYQQDGSCSFCVWAPYVKQLSLKLLLPLERIVPMQPTREGYWHTTLSDVTPGTRYLYVLDGNKERPDPASFFQPEGVHGPSEIIDPRDHSWNDQDWKPASLNQWIIYEIHVGTFTPEGTFDGVITRLRDLKELGINAIELMPVSAFPGARNWGYDGTYCFAVADCYGGPAGLKRLVDACHAEKMAIVLDVVYNHFGPEGNYLGNYCPYFTRQHVSPWGRAINFDGPQSTPIRQFFFQNAIYWFDEYHFDALRLDAVHGIIDTGAKHFLKELGEYVHDNNQRAGRRRYLIAESDLNDIIMVKPQEEGGYGMDAQWCDDFHHVIHTLLTGEHNGYYADYGRFEDLLKTFKEGFVYDWKYSYYRQRFHGSSSKNVPRDRLLVFMQNHDQIGNRMLGERLASLISFEALKLSAALVLLSPYVPLLFMGEEYAEDAPFLYFISHSDPDLVKAVQEGRKEEFRSFGWNKDVPDPQSEQTFQKSKLVWDKKNSGHHKRMLDYYKEIIRVRLDHHVFKSMDRRNIKVWAEQEKGLLILQYLPDNDKALTCFFNFSQNSTQLARGVMKGGWQKILDSADLQWMGPGSSAPLAIVPQSQTLGISPLSCVLYEKI